MNDTKLAVIPRDEDSARGSSAGTPPRPPKLLAHQDVYGSPRGRIAELVLGIAILTVGGLVDVALAKMTLDLALRLPEGVSWGVAIGVSAIAITAAWSAGWCARTRQLAGAVAAGAFSLFIAAALFALRWNEHAFSKGSASWEGTTTTGDSSGGQALAWIMLLVFLATCGLALLDGYRLADIGRRVRETQLRFERANAAEADAAAAIVRLDEETAKATYVLRHIDEDSAAARAALEALRDELIAWSHIEIARVLGDPVATSGVTPSARAAAGNGVPTENDHDRNHEEKK